MQIVSAFVTFLVYRATKYAILYDVAGARSYNRRMLPLDHGWLRIFRPALLGGRYRCSISAINNSVNNNLFRLYLRFFYRFALASLNRANKTRRDRATDFYRERAITRDTLFPDSIENRIHRCRLWTAAKVIASDSCVVYNIAKAVPVDRY